MTYYQVAQRGGQPLYYASQISRRPAERAVRPQGNGVKFGGGVGKSAIDSSVAIFQKINEVFIWGFMAQDVVGMWLPRVGTSLKVGREPYDPSEDPEAKNLPFSQQVKKWIIGNVRGLNWVNFSEGTKRESATGPGLLAVPALMFLANRYVGDPAQELSYTSLKNLGAGFKAHLATKEKQGQPIRTEAAFRREVQDYIRSMFVDPDLKGVTLGKSNLDDWCQQWAKTQFEETATSAWDRVKGNFKKSASAKTLDDMADALQDGVRSFNRSERVLAYAKPKGESKLAQFMKDSAPLHHADHAWVSYRPHLVGEEAGKYIAQVPVSRVTEDLKRFGWYARTVWKNHEAKKAGYTVLSEAVEQTMKDLVGKKFLLGLGTTVISALYLMKLAFWAQNHGTYQAVRLFQENGGKHGKPAVGGKSHPDAMQQASGLQPNTAQPVQSFAPQPGFSHFSYQPVSKPYSGMAFPLPGMTPQIPAAAFRGQPASPVEWRQQR